MRAFCCFAVLVIAVGCGAPVASEKPKEGAQAPPTNPKRDAKNPKEKGAPPPKKVESEKTDPKKDDVRFSLADARVKILNTNKDGVKKLLGAPDGTVMSTYNGVITNVWVYRSQRVIWNEDTEKYYPFIAVAFYHKPDGGDPGNAIEVKTE